MRKREGGIRERRREEGKEEEEKVTGSREQEGSVPAVTTPSLVC